MKRKAMYLAVLSALVALGGCANLRFQWAASYATENVLADMERGAGK